MGHLKIARLVQFFGHQNCQYSSQHENKLAYILTGQMNADKMLKENLTLSAKESLEVGLIDEIISQQGFEQGDIYC